MMNRTSNSNQAIQSTLPDATTLGLKLNDYRDRRRSIDQQNDHEIPKRLQHDQFLFATDSKIQTKDRKTVTDDKQDNEEKQFRAAVDSLGPYDVICGKGSVAFNNVGNRRFRILITMNVDSYNNVNGRHRKGLFIGSLVNTFVDEIGARFFKLQGGRLVELTERQIRQKVGHALRDVLAFQERQCNHQQQTQTKHQHKPQEKYTQRNYTKEGMATEKSKPWIIGRTTAMSRAKNALSSIRSRFNKIRMERDYIQTHNHSLPSPLPPPVNAPYRSNITSRQNLFPALVSIDNAQNQSQDTRTTETETPSSITSLATRQFSSKPNYFPVAGIMEQHSASAMEVSHERSPRNSRSQKHYTWNENKNTSFGSYISNSHDSCNISMRESNQYHHNNSFSNRHSDIDHPLEDDLSPIPINDHHEQLKMLDF